MLDIRLRSARDAADCIAIDRGVAPSENGEVLFADDFFDDAFALLTGGRLDGQERHADAVFSGGREGEAELSALAHEISVRYLDQDAGAIACFGIASAGPAVRQVDQNLDALDDDVVGFLPLDVRHEAHTTASVVLEKARVIEALGGR